MRRTLLRAVPATVALGLILPAAASAATVSAQNGRLSFVGAPGEANAVSIQSTRVEDTGAPLEPGDGCHYDREGTHVECDYFFEGSIQLGDGDDRLTLDRSGAFAPMSIDAGTGSDTLKIWGPLSRVDGGPGDDRIAVDTSAAYYVAGAEVQGGDGDDDLSTVDRGTTDGGPGNDTLTAITGARGGDGNDRITVTAAPTGYQPPGSWSGPPGGVFPGMACTRSPRPTAAAAEGGPGEDVIGGSPGTETLAGGDGDDRLDGGEGGDSLAGEGGADVLDGGPGNDDVLGGDGRDLLAGGDGDDSVEGGGDGDAVAGGEGTDESCYGPRPRGIVVDLTTPGDDGEPGEGDSIAADVERIGGTDRDDTIVGGDRPFEGRGGGGDDTIRGGPGGDSIDGGRGDDLLTGGPGDDSLGGGELRRADGGDDTLDGGPGNDLLGGSHGDDWLSGGPGRDGLSGQEGPGFVAGTTGAPLSAGGAINHSPIVSMAHGDQIWCGESIDRVSAEFADAVAADCEETFEGAGKWKRRSLTSAGRVKVSARCAWESGRACKGTIRVLAAASDREGTVAASRSSAYGAGTPTWCKPLSRPTAPLARVRFDVRAGRVGRLEAALTRRGRALIARRGCVPVRIALEFKDGGGRAYGSSRAVALSHKGFRP